LVKRLTEAPSYRSATILQITFSNTIISIVNTTKVQLTMYLLGYFNRNLHNLFDLR
jgi:hypothetical protein